MLFFAVLESIIIPIPVDPLLIATVLARPKNWIKLVAACTIASVIGGGLGWVIGVWLTVGVEQLLFYLPHAVATPEKFAAVQDGFMELGILLVFIGAFSSALQGHCSKRWRCRFWPHTLSCHLADWARTPVCHYCRYHPSPW